MTLLFKVFQLLYILVPVLYPNSFIKATPFVEEPQSQNVIVGETVTFRCVRRQSQSCTVLWYSVDSQTFISRNKNLLDGFRGGHYELEGKSPNDFSLTINNVTKADIGDYQCICFVTQEYFTPPATLSVFELPLPTPTIKGKYSEEVDRLTLAVYTNPIRQTGPMGTLLDLQPQQWLNKQGAECSPRNFG